MQRNDKAKSWLFFIKTNKTDRLLERMVNEMEWGESKGCP